MSVVVTILEAHFVRVLVSMPIVTMNVIVNDMVVLMRVVGVVMDLLTMHMLVVMRCRVFVFLAHFPTSFLVVCLLRSIAVTPNVA